MCSETTQSGRGQARGRSSRHVRVRLGCGAKSRCVVLIRRPRLPTRVPGEPQAVALAPQAPHHVPPDQAGHRRCCQPLRRQRRRSSTLLFLSFRLERGHLPRDRRHSSETHQTVRIAASLEQLNGLFGLRVAARERTRPPLPFPLPRLIAGRTTLLTSADNLLPILAVRQPGDEDAVTHIELRAVTSTR